MNNSTPYQQTTSRDRFLKVVLRATCVIGFVAVAFYLFTPALVVFKLFAVLGYGLLVGITLLTDLPYELRAGVFLLIVYFTGLGSLSGRGIAEASILWLGFIAMTALLFSSRTSIYFALGVILLTLLGFGWLSSSLADVAWLAGTFLLVSGILGLGLYTFQQEFMHIQASALQMLNTIQEEHSSLEQHVEERTAGLTRKSELLRAIAYITRKITETQDLNLLLSTAAELIVDQFQFYHAGIFLINETGDRVVLQAVSSEGGRRMIERGHSSPVGSQDIIGYVAAQKKPHIALDVGPDAVIFNNPDLPMTRSEVAFPLSIRNKTIGVLDIQSAMPQAFSIDDLDLLQTLADQIAIAIENARLIDEAQAAILQLEGLTSSRTREAWNRKLSERSRVFTYTPLGLRAEKSSQDGNEVISAPIVLRGQKIGNISIARKGNAAWNKLDKDLIDEVAGQVGLAVDSIRLLEEATQRARHEQIVGKLAAKFSQSLDLDTLLQTAARELGQLPDVSEVSVVISPETEQNSQLRQRTRRNVS